MEHQKGPVIDSKKGKRALRKWSHRVSYCSPQEVQKGPSLKGSLCEQQFPVSNLFQRAHKKAALNFLRIKLSVSGSKKGSLEERKALRTVSTFRWHVKQLLFASQARRNNVSTIFRPRDPRWPQDPSPPKGPPRHPNLDFLRFQTFLINFPKIVN